MGFYAFLSRHGQHAGLQLRYPDARVYSNAIVPQVISVYKETFASEKISEAEYQKRFDEFYGMDDEEEDEDYDEDDDDDE